jgi:hypothetical protein
LFDADVEQVYENMGDELAVMYFVVTFSQPLEGRSSPAAVSGVRLSTMHGSRRPFARVNMMLGTSKIEWVPGNFPCVNRPAHLRVVQKLLSSRSVVTLGWRGWANAAPA